MVATLEAVWNGGHVVFGAACYMHGLLTTPDWQTLEVIFHILTCTMHIFPKQGRGQRLEARISSSKRKYIFTQVEGVTAESVLLSWLGGERVLRNIFTTFLN